MPNLKNPTSSEPTGAATGGSHHFATPVVREITPPTAEPRSISTAW